MTTPIPSELRAAIVIGQLDYGGAERQLALLALRAREHRVSPHVFSLGGVEEPYGSLLRDRGVPLSTVPRRGSFDLARALRLGALFRKRSFDLVHSFLIDTNPYAFVASRLARISSFVASNRNADFPRGALRAALDGIVFRRASTVLVNARAVERFTARRFNVPPDRFSLIYNGVDLERFRPPPLRARDGLTVGSVGSLTAKKNPELFARVAVEVRRRFPAARFRHLGDGPLRHHLVARHGDAIEYPGTSAAAEEFLASLDVFVLTSDREGCPNALLEAMACGRAVVTTSAGGAPEVVEDGSSGYLAPLGDAGALAERVCRLLGDPELRERMGSAARLEVERRFSSQRMVKETVELYRRVVGAAGAAEAA